MVQEDLMKSMEATAEEQKKELLARALQTAATIMGEARAKTGEIKAELMAAAVREAETERNRSLYSANSDLKKELTVLKYEHLGRAITMAEEELGTIRDSQDYPGCYRQLIQEALRELDNHDVVLHIDPGDEGLCGRTLADLGAGCKVVPDLTCKGGINASSGDGKVLICNTFEARLERAKERMKLDIFRTLYGD